MSDRDIDELKFSRHARLQQAEQDISDEFVYEAIRHGVKMDIRDATIYRDSNIKVVVINEAWTVAEVCRNARNTRFQLSERTKEKEESLLYKVYEEDNRSAMCELGELYLKGELGEKDPQKAHNLYERAAIMGSSHAMCKLSQLYESGELGKPNQKLADKWMKEAAERNNVYATAIIGQELLLKYLEKYPVNSKLFRPSAPKNEILYYLNKSADKGGSRATWQLGEIYELGLLGEKDLSKAIEFYVRAAKTGSPTSLITLYNMSHDGKFSAIDIEEILDNVSSLLINTSMGVAFDKGCEQVSGELGYNPNRGLKMIEAVALKQYDEAMLKLAKCYRDGRACDVNPKLAQYWFTKLHELYRDSAAAGNVISLRKLGKLHLNGNVGDIDLEKAKSYFEEAIEKSPDPDWIYGLGKLYFKGRLGNKPINTGIQLIMRAIKMWQLQIEQGNTDAYFDLGDAYISINFHKKAVYWLSKSSSKNTDSQLLLAKIYLNDVSPEKNISLGLKILEYVILENNISPKVAFDTAQFKFNDQTVTWLQDIADSAAKPVLTTNSNERALKKFAVATLANVYETGELGEINNKVVSQYYYKLYIDFEDIEAGKKLVWLYINGNLPKEYFDKIKNWVLQIPTLLESDATGFCDFVDYILLLGKVYQKGDIFPYDVKEATKWLYIASYFHCSDSSKKEHIKQDLANLPTLDSNQKEEIVSELSRIAQNTKLILPLKYKVLSRILGDIFYDNKIINQNMEKAIFWYTESTHVNNGLASLALGKIYQYDKQDIDTSIKWYILSTQLGNKDALKALTAIVKEHHLENLVPFLNKYQHQSAIQESELMDIKPFKNLEVYPKSVQEMHDLGKSYLDLENRQDVDILNAAFWFRKAMKRGSIDAGIELFSMYMSGMLGNHLIAVADNLYQDILKMCYSELRKNSAIQDKDISSVLSVLNNLSSLLRVSNNVPSALSESIERLISQTHDSDSDSLNGIVSGLKLLKLELGSTIIDTTTSNYLNIRPLVR